MIYKQKLQQDFCCLIDNDSWQLHHKEENFMLWVKDVGSTIKMLKAEVDISNVPLTHMYNFIMEPGMRKRWDPYCINNRIIARIENYGDISYSEIKFPPPLKNRDYVYMRFWDCKPTEFNIFGRSVDYDDWNAHPNVIRSVIHISGYHCRQISDTQVRMFFITKSDPMGVLPAWFVNKAAPNRIKKFVMNFVKEVGVYSGPLKKDPTHKYIAISEHVKIAPAVDWDKLKLPGSLNEEQLDESHLKEETN